VAKGEGVANYNIDAINSCMTSVQNFKPKFGEIADSFHNVPSDASAYGTLPNSGAVSSAVDSVNNLMSGQFDKAEQLLDQIARALDAVVQSVQNVETHTAKNMAV
jgi:ABC-type transporter Mla subunit MlaD